MPGVRLDISREIPCADFGEIGCYAGGDGWDGGYPGGKAVAAAVGEVVCCEGGMSVHVHPSQKKKKRPRLGPEGRGGRGAGKGG